MAEEQWERIDGPEEPTRSKLPDDILALSRIERLLVALEDDARSRCVIWLAQKYGSELVWDKIEFAEKYEPGTAYLAKLWEQFRELEGKEKPLWWRR